MHAKPAGRNVALDIAAIDQQEDRRLPGIDVDPHAAAAVVSSPGRRPPGIASRVRREAGSAAVTQPAGCIGLHQVQWIWLGAIRVRRRAPPAAGCRGVTTVMPRFGDAARAGEQDLRADAGGDAIGGQRNGPVGRAIGGGIGRCQPPRLEVGGIGIDQDAGHGKGATGHDPDPATGGGGEQAACRDAPGTACGQVDIAGGAEQAAPHQAERTPGGDASRPAAVTWSAVSAETPPPARISRLVAPLARRPHSAARHRRWLRLPPGHPRCCADRLPAAAAIGQGDPVRPQRGRAGADQAAARLGDAAGGRGQRQPAGRPPGCCRSAPHCARLVVATRSAPEVTPGADQAQPGSGGDRQAGIGRQRRRHGRDHATGGRAPGCRRQSARQAVRVMSPPASRACPPLARRVLVVTPMAPPAVSDWPVPADKVLPLTSMAPPAESVSVAAAAARWNCRW